MQNSTQNSFHVNQLSTQINQLSPRSEVQNSLKQYTNKQDKITFLTQENIQLQNQIAELAEVIKLNSEAVDFALYQEFQKHPSEQENDITSKQQNKQDIIKSLHQIIQKGQKENDELVQQIFILAEERNLAQSKALINEQISECHQKQEKELMRELEDRVIQLQNKIKEDEMTLLNLEKIQPVYDEDSQIVIKFREVLVPQDQIKKLKQENEKLQNIITKQQKAINNLQQERYESTQINEQLNNQLQRSSINYNINSLIQAQKALLQSVSMQNTDDEEEDIHIDDNLPDKIQMGSPQIQKLPQLDLTKAKMIQEALAKKMIEQQNQQQENSQYAEYEKRLTKINDEVELTKKKLQKEMLINKAMELENENIQRFNEELEVRNETIQEANDLMENNLVKLNDELEFYEQYYFKYKDFVKKYYEEKQTQDSIYKDKEIQILNEEVLNELNSDKNSEDNNIQMQEEYNSIAKRFKENRNDGKVKSQLYQEFYKLKKQDYKQDPEFKKLPVQELNSWKNESVEVKDKYQNVYSQQIGIYKYQKSQLKSHCKKNDKREQLIQNLKKQINELCTQHKMEIQEELQDFEPEQFVENKYYKNIEKLNLDVQQFKEEEIEILLKEEEEPFLQSNEFKEGDPSNLFENQFNTSIEKNNHS